MFKMSRSPKVLQVAVSHVWVSPFLKKSLDGALDVWGDPLGDNGVGAGLTRHAIASAEHVSGRSLSETGVLHNLGRHGLCGEGLMRHDIREEDIVG